jgi:energy-coupling factor transporter transmembrane protein EcfT
MTEIRNLILAGMLFGLLLGIFFGIRFGLRTALIAGPIAGLAFGLILYFFMTSSVVKRQTEIEHLDGMTIIRSAAANHFVNGEAIGGKLYLLPDKLQFQSHGFNIQNSKLILSIKEIKEVGFYNTLWLISNGLVVTTLSGQTEKFVVSKRQLWKDAIEKQKANAQ